jgi:hypothetical protein
MAFAIEAFQNRYLAPGQSRVDAILSVSAGSDVATQGARQLVVGFIVDKSGSMEGERLEAVKQAVWRGIDKLDASDWFFVVAFDSQAVVVVDECDASPMNKAGAAQALAALRAGGGTAMSTGLAAARAIATRLSGAICQCIFLTDGKNESEKPTDVAAELKRCAGRFECDCWGVGTSWHVGEVQEIARALLGKASLIPDASGVEEAFRQAIEKASAKALKDARLRLWTPQTARLAFVKQVHPTLEDLTAKGRDVPPQAHEFFTGAWSPGETREFHIGIDVHAATTGDEMLACRPSMVYLAPGKAGEGQNGWVEHEDKAPNARIFASWTDDGTLSSRIDGHVAHYSGQDELAQAIATGLERREHGDEVAATQHLGRAVKLAHESGNVEMTQRLAKVVEVLDAPAGTVRLRRTVKKEAAMDLELESRTTKRARKGAGHEQQGGGP